MYNSILVIAFLSCRTYRKNPFYGKFMNILRFAPKLRNFSKMGSEKYIWMDLEMTGLNPEQDKILEVACLVSTTDLKPLDDGINMVIHQTDEVLESMNDWCKVHHVKSGLVDECKTSKIELPEAEKKVFNYIKNHVEENGNNYIAGNSIYMDLMFIKKYFPSLTDLFHYRLVDVSVLKTLISHWYPNEFSKYQKHRGHRAMDDIRSSIKELEFYKTFLK